MPTSTTVFGIVKPSSGSEPADVYGISTRLADSTEAALVANLGTWASYSPTLTNFTATVNSARWVQQGKVVRVEFSLTLTGAVTSTMLMTKPVASSSSSALIAIGHALAVDTSVGSSSRRSLGLAHNSTTDLYFYSATGGTTSATVPFTWASGDTVGGAFSYEVP